MSVCVYIHIWVWSEKHLFVASLHLMLLDGKYTKKNSDGLLFS